MLPNTFKVFVSNPIMQQIQIEALKCGASWSDAPESIQIRPESGLLFDRNAPNVPWRISPIKTLSEYYAVSAPILSARKVILGLEELARNLPLLGAPFKVRILLGDMLSRLKRMESCGITLDKKPLHKLLLGYGFYVRAGKIYPRSNKDSFESVPFPEITCSSLDEFLTSYSTFQRNKPWVRVFFSPASNPDVLYREKTKLVANLLRLGYVSANLGQRGSILGFPLEEGSICIGVDSKRFVLLPKNLECLECSSCSGTGIPFRDVFTVFAPISALSVSPVSALKLPPKGKNMPEKKCSSRIKTESEPKRSGLETVKVVLGYQSGKFLENLIRGGISWRTPVSSLQISEACGVAISFSTKKMWLYLSGSSFFQATTVREVSIEEAMRLVTEYYPPKPEPGLESNLRHELSPKGRNMLKKERLPQIKTESEPKRVQSEAATVKLRFKFDRFRAIETLTRHGNWRFVPEPATIEAAFGVAFSLKTGEIWLYPTERSFSHARTVREVTFEGLCEILREKAEFEKNRDKLIKPGPCETSLKKVKRSSDTLELEPNPKHGLPLKGKFHVFRHAVSGGVPTYFHVSSWGTLQEARKAAEALCRGSGNNVTVTQTISSFVSEIIVKET